MNSYALDVVPLWLVLVATVAFVLGALEVGFLLGSHRARIAEHERHAPIDPLVGSVLGMLAFILAFTFGMATARHDARNRAVLDDVIAIRSADLRAQVLPEPERNEVRGLLREYVDVRITAALVPGELTHALLRTDELQDQLWARATALSQQADATPAVESFMQALIAVFDMHSVRVTTDVGDRIPGTIWIGLYAITVLAMAITGYRVGIGGRRSFIATLILALAFSVVIALIADLDRPQDGFIKVSQQAMLDLQTRLHHP